MKPEETGSHYDRIALWWQQQHMDSTYGIAALERAIQFVENRSTALDIGCGSSGTSLCGAGDDECGRPLAFVGYEGNTRPTPKIEAALIEAGYL
jgi:hypothetical protein